MAKLPPYLSRTFAHEQDGNSGKKLAKGFDVSRVKLEAEAKARALALSDEMAARIIKAKGGIVVAPKGLVDKPMPSVLVSIGWAEVRVAMRDDGLRAAFTTFKNGRHNVRAGRGSEAREKKFWGHAEIGEGYFQEYVKACGIPTLDDFEATLTTPKGAPLAEQAEKSSRQRAVQHGYGHGMQPGWFIDLYRKQNGLCALSGLPMIRRSGILCECLPVPDRIDSDIGYFPGNVRLVRHGLNMMRRDRDDATFARLCASMFLLRAA